MPIRQQPLSLIAPVLSPQRRRSRWPVLAALAAAAIALLVLLPESTPQTTTAPGLVSVTSTPSHPLDQLTHDNTAIDDALLSMELQLVLMDLED